MRVMKSLVERDDGGERLTGRRRAEPKPMLARSVGDDDMASVDPGEVGKPSAPSARGSTGAAASTPPVRRPE